MSSPCAPYRRETSASGPNYIHLFSNQATIGFWSIWQHARMRAFAHPASFMGHTLLNNLFPDYQVTKDGKTGDYFFVIESDYQNRFFFARRCQESASEQHQNQSGQLTEYGQKPCF